MAQVSGRKDGEAIKMAGKWLENGDVHGIKRICFMNDLTEILWS
jgi:hypothetical protein